MQRKLKTNHERNDRTNGLKQLRQLVYHKIHKWHYEDIVLFSILINIWNKLSDKRITRNRSIRIVICPAPNVPTTACLPLGACRHSQLEWDRNFLIDMTSRHRRMRIMTLSSDWRHLACCRIPTTNRIDGLFISITTDKCIPRWMHGGIIVANVAETTQCWLAAEKPFFNQYKYK